MHLHSHYAMYSRNLYRSNGITLKVEYKKKRFEKSALIHSVKQYFFVYTVFVLSSLDDRVLAAISIHSYGQEIYYPQVTYQYIHTDRKYTITIHR